MALCLNQKNYMNELFSSECFNDSFETNPS